MELILYYSLGNELAVLEGSKKTIQEVHPLIIFECWQGNERLKILDFFMSRNYSIYDLPWSPNSNIDPLVLDSFLESPSTNFIAIPNQDFSHSTEELLP